MPGQNRKIFQEPPPGQLFAACPVGLALLGPDGLVQWNPAARNVLRDRVGSGEPAWTRWTNAAAERLQASGRLIEALPGILAREKGLEVRITPPTESGYRVMAILEADPREVGQDDLAETVSTLSHELRTPLTSMKSSLALVISGETGQLSGEQLHFLSMTMRNIDRLDRLVGDLLDVARADAGQLNLRTTRVDAVQTVTETVEAFRPAAAGAGLELDLQVHGPVPEVYLDGDKLVQMVGNLLGNAIKYTPSGGQVRVRLESNQECGQLRIEVRDNGPGMDEEARWRALQPFQRSEAANRSLVPGAGLGLHISKRLAEAVGGRLGFESRVGQGTLVWIELPVGQDQNSDPVELLEEPAGV